MVPETTALLLIDVQEGFNDLYWGSRNNPAFEENIAKVLESFRMRGLPIIHVQHLSLEANSPLRADRPGSAFMKCAEPQAGEPIVQKHVNSAFIGTELEALLRRAGITDLVIAGLSTDHCVSTTTRMAGNLGFRVWLLSDATATFDRRGLQGDHYPADLVHSVSLASLDREFASVVTTAQLVAR